MASSTDIKLMTANNDVLAADKAASDATSKYTKLIEAAMRNPITGLPTIGAGVDPAMIKGTAGVKTALANGNDALAALQGQYDTAAQAQYQDALDLGQAKIATGAADQHRAQMLADQNKAINDSFNITDKVVQANQERWAAYEEGKRSRAAAEAVRNVTITDDPLAWLLKGAVVPSLAAEADASEANFKAATDVINQTQQAAQNQQVLQNSEIPSITLEQQAARAKEIAITAKAQADAITAQRAQTNADFQAKIIANNVNAAEADYRLGAAKLNQRNESINSQARNVAFQQQQRDNQLILAEKYKNIKDTEAKQKLQDAHLAAGALMLGLDTSKMSVAQLNLALGDNAQAVRYMGATGSYGNTPLEIVSTLKSLNANIGKMTDQGKATFKIYNDVYTKVINDAKKGSNAATYPDPKGIGKDAATTQFYEQKMNEELKSVFSTNAGAGALLSPQRLLGQVLAPQGGVNLNSPMGAAAYKTLNTVTFGVIRSMAKGEAQGGVKSDPQATVFSIYDANRKAGLNQVDAAKQAYGTLKLMADGRMTGLDKRMVPDDLIKTEDMRIGGNGDYEGFAIKYADIQKMIIKRDRDRIIAAVMQQHKTDMTKGLLGAIGNF